MIFQFLIVQKHFILQQGASNYAELLILTILGVHTAIEKISVPNGTRQMDGAPTLTFPIPHNPDSGHSDVASTRCARISNQLNLASQSRHHIKILFSQKEI